MIKKSTLFTITSVFIFLSYITSVFIISQVPNVTVFNPTPQTVTSTVSCSGKIEYSENKTISSGLIGKIEEIYVSEGDYVTKGEKLFSVSQDISSLESIENIDMAEIPDDMLANSVLNGDINSLDEYTGDGIAIQNNNSSEVEVEDIVSEYSGIVGAVDKAVGDVITSEEKIMEISDSNSIQACLQVSESKIGDIKIGQSANIECSALKDKQINGTVSKIGGVAKQTTTTLGKETSVDIIVKIDESQVTEEIKPGYTVKCNIIVDSKDDAILLPYESVRYDDNGKEYVMCYTQNGICEKRTIKTGDEYKNGVEVLSGVDSSDLILSSPDGISDSSFAKATEENDD